jgi:hypothetical protein
MRTGRPEPAVEVTGTPAAVRGDDDLDTRGPDGGQQVADVLVLAGVTRVD